MGEGCGGKRVRIETHSFAAWGLEVVELVGLVGGGIEPSGNVSLKPVMSIVGSGGIGNEVDSGGMSLDEVERYSRKASSKQKLRNGGSQGSESNNHSNLGRNGNVTRKTENTAREKTATALTAREPPTRISPNTITPTDMFEVLARHTSSFSREENNFSMGISKAYTMPDGELILVGRERLDCGEIFFRPELMLRPSLLCGSGKFPLEGWPCDGADEEEEDFLHQSWLAPEVLVPGGGSNRNINSGDVNEKKSNVELPPNDIPPLRTPETLPQSLPDAIVSALNRCDLDLRAHLFSNIMIFGGPSMMFRFPQRLELEVRAQVPLKRRKGVRIVAAPERKFSTWIGGSILGSLGRNR